MKRKHRLSLGPDWPIVLVAFYGCCVHAGCLIYAFSLFISPLQAAFGWDRTAIMTASTLQLLCLGLVSPLVGKAVDIYGSRRIVSSGALVSAAGFLLMPTMETTIHFYLCNIIIGIGSAAMGPVPCSAAVTEAFDEKRGIAIGIMSTGIGIGGFVIAPLIGGMILPGFGWQAAYVCIAGITILMVPLAMLFLKGKSGRAETMAQSSGRQAFPAASTVKKDLVSAPFILIAGGFFLFLFSAVGVLQTQVPHLQDVGFPLLLASSAMGALALVSAVGKFVFGLLCDRYHPKVAFSIGAVFLMAGIFILRNISTESSPALIWVFAIVFGIGVGSWLPSMSMMVSRTFAKASYGTIFGAVTLIQQMGSAMGPLASGYIYDMTGNYQPAFDLYLLLAFCAVGVIVASGFVIKNRPCISIPAHEATG